MNAAQQILKLAKNAEPAWVGVHSGWPSLTNEIRHEQYKRLPITMGELRDRSWMEREFAFHCKEGPASRWTHAAVWTKEKGGQRLMVIALNPSAGDHTSTGVFFGGPSRERLAS